MNLRLDRDHWNRDKIKFSDIVDINVELMYELRKYFYGFMDCPIDIYGRYTIEAESKSFKSFKTIDELKSHIKNQYNTGVLMILYCILMDHGIVTLRSAILPDTP